MIFEPYPFSCVNRSLPAVYGDEINYYETLCQLIYKINELVEYLNTLNPEQFATKDELINEIQALEEKILNIFNVDQAEQTVLLKAHTIEKVNQLKANIEDQIRGIVVGQIQVFDPTYGIDLRPVDTVIRNVYHWLRYFADYALTLDTLNATAQDRDAMMLSAKTFDLYNMQYYSKSPTPTPTPPEYEKYVPKHDILAYYFDRQLQTGGGEINA